MLFMGIDVGTQGVRIIVVDELGNIIAGSSRSFSTLNIANEPNKFEQRSDDWWDTTVHSIQECLSLLSIKGHEAEEIIAISIDGTSGTIVPLDKSNRPLCNAIMYNDMRAAKQVEEVHNKLQRLESKLGLYFNASFSLPKIVWILENWPEIYEQTNMFAHQTDYIVGKLSGEYSVSDYSSSLKTGYDLFEDQWPSSISELGIETSKLPKIVAPGSYIGQVSIQTSKLLGLSPKTKIVGGSTDGYASALAAGAVGIGDWASIIGTTLVLKGVTKDLIIDPTGSSYSHKLPSGYWMLGGASNIGGRCLNNNFEKSSFSEYNKTVDQISPTGLICYPLTGMGERFPFVDPLAEFYISRDVENKQILYAALMEGVGFGEKLAFERMVNLGCPVGNVIYTAGGACRSQEWLRIRASILNRQLKVPMVVDAAMGSAILASSEYFGSLEQAAARIIHIDKIIDPVREKVEKFEELYQLFYLECQKRYRLGW